MLNPIVTISAQVFVEFRSILNIISKNSDEIIIENGKLVQKLTSGNTILYADLTTMLGAPIDFTINKLKDVVKKPLKVMTGHNNVVFFDDTENEQYVMTNKVMQVITNKLVKDKIKPATIPDLSNIDTDVVVDSVKLNTDLEAVKEICNGEEDIKLLVHDNELFGLSCSNITFIFNQYEDKYDASNLPKTNTDGSPLLSFTSQSFLCMKPTLSLEIKIIKAENIYWLITNYSGTCPYMTYENLVVSTGGDDESEFEV